MARTDLIAIAAVSLLASACTSTNAPGPCKSNADCGVGQTCNSKGQCLGQVVSAAVTSGGTKGTTGSVAATTSSSSTSSGAVNGTSGGPAASSTSGSAAGPTTSSSSGSTSGAATSGGSTTTTGGGGCSCSTNCCSQIGGDEGITCPDGKMCYGTVPDSGQAFYCNDQTGKCDPFDPCSGNSGVWTCGGSTGTSGTTGGMPATVDPTGLSFVIVGDTRPGDTSSPYPTATIQAIYTDFTQLSPLPMAVVATGDFQEDGDQSTATSMIDDYESAVALYTTGPTYPVMGNHECVSTSITTYCEVGGNTTVNFTAFMQMLTDLHIPNTNGQPYYYETLTAPNGDTAKFVVTAAQAWDSTQVTWLNNTLALPSTFTFLARHEPDDAVGCSNTPSTSTDYTTNSCPFIADVQTAINSHPGGVTLKLTGHTHEIRFDNDNDEIVSGSGGAPIETTCSSNSPSTTYCNFGYVYCQELTNKTFLCTAYDMTSGPLTTPGQRIAANGTPTGVLSYAQ